MSSKKISAVVILGLISIMISLYYLSIHFFNSPEMFAKIIFDDCKEKRDKKECYLGKFSKLGNDIAFNKLVLTELQIFDKTALDCHIIAHKIGIVAVNKNPENWRKLLQDNADYNQCLGGYAHGIIEGFFYRENKKLDANLIEELCNSELENIRTNCLHIIGHLLLLQEKGDIKKALLICDKLFDNYECYLGVFMEYTTRFGLIDHKIAEAMDVNEKTINELESFCETLNTIAQKACASEMGRLYRIYHKGNFSKNIDSCFEMGGLENIKSCINFSLVSKLGSEISYAKIIETCSYFSESKIYSKEQCILVSLSYVRTVRNNIEFNNIALLCQDRSIKRKRICNSLLEDLKTGNYHTIDL